MVDVQFKEILGKNNGAMVKIVNLTKRYENILAVNNLNIEIAPGEIFGLLGSNGAGKTTTLQILAGLLKPTSGDVFVSGMDIRKQALNIKRILGYLPESPAVYEQLTGIEFLNFVGRLRGMPEGGIEERVRTLTEILDLTDRIDSKLSSYSKGMKQKISFAATMVEAVCTRVMILDKGITKSCGTIPDLKSQTETESLEAAFIQLTGGPIRADF
jgi:ABC-2 type transport system ATP-binding protein